MSEIGHLLCDLCDIQSYSPTTNEIGEDVPGWTTLATGVACLAQQMGATSAYRYGLKNQTKPFQIMFDQDLGLGPNNRIKLTKWHGRSVDIRIWVDRLEEDGRPGEAVCWTALGGLDPGEREVFND